MSKNVKSLLFSAVLLAMLFITAPSFAEYEEILITDYQAYAGTITVNGQSEIDWAPAIQEAVDDGYVPFFPDGVYYLGSKVFVNHFTGIRGASCNGVIFRIMHQNSAFEFTARCRFENFSLEYPEQTLTGTPVVHGPALKGIRWTNPLNPSDVRTPYYVVIQNIDLGNAYDGIVCLDGVGMAASTIQNIRGFPYHYGIYLDDTYDYLHISDIVFDPRPYGWATYEQGGSNLTMLNWVRSYGRAFHFGRCDWGNITNLYAYGYMFAFYLTSSATPANGSLNRMTFMDCSSEGCRFHIYADHNEGFQFIGGHFETYNPVYGGSETASGEAIKIQGTGPVVLMGITSYESMGPAALIEAPTKIIGCFFYNAISAGWSTWAGEVVKFSGSSAGSAMIGCTLDIASGINNSRSVRVSVDGVMLSNNVYDPAGAQDVMLDSGVTAELDGHGIGDTSGRNDMIPTSSQRKGYLYYDSTLGKMIMYKNSGWYNVNGTSLN